MPTRAVQCAGAELTCHLATGLQCRNHLHCDVSSEHRASPFFRYTPSVCVPECRCNTSNTPFLQYSNAPQTPVMPSNSIRVSCLRKHPAGPWFHVRPEPPRLSYSLRHFGSATSTSCGTAGPSVSRSALRWSWSLSRRPRPSSAARSVSWWCSASASSGTATRTWSLV